MRGVLCLEDGFFIQGHLLNYARETPGEVVFSTGMTGYEEALTDPSFCGQILVFAFPMIGNYGMPPGSGQSGSVMVRGIVARDVWDTERAWPAALRLSQATGPPDVIRREAPPESLPRALAKHGCPVLYGLDTRALVLHLREHGAQKGVISAVPETGLGPREVTGLVERAARYDMRRVVEEVSCKEVALLEKGASPRGTCVLVDFGVKTAIVSALLDMGFRVYRVPPSTPAGQVMSFRPDSVIMSNGPGDPGDNVLAIETARGLLGKVPLFGICLGHQVIAIAAGARITKLKYGHHGGNHPVKDQKTARVFVSSQNHNYTVDDAGLPANVCVTYRNVNDGTVEGLEVRDDRDVLASSIQFHPEGAPGPGYPQFWGCLAGVQGGGARNA
jgi:carbamoyl-phosphate synthase small subunit